MACRDEPPLSLIAAIAVVIMSMYGGCAAGRRAAAFFARGFLLFAIFRAGLLDLDLERDLERDLDLDLDLDRDLDFCFTTPDMVNAKWNTN